MSKLIDIDFSGLFLAPNDEPVVDQEGKQIHMAKFLAASLYHSRKGDALKFFDWSTSLYKTAKLAIDQSDYETLYQWVKSDESMSNGFRAQILNRMDAAKTAANTKTA